MLTGVTPNNKTVFIPDGTSIMSPIIVRAEEAFRGDNKRKRTATRYSFIIDQQTIGS